MKYFQKLSQKRILEYFFRTAPFLIINDRKKSIIVKEFESMKNSIQWNELGTASNIMEATEEARLGRDLGWDKTRALMPNNYDFHHWMNFAHLLTVIYNRDLEPKRYSILRVVITVFIIIDSLAEEVGRYSL